MKTLCHAFSLMLLLLFAHTMGWTAALYARSPQDAQAASKAQAQGPDSTATGSSAAPNQAPKQSSVEAAQASGQPQMQVMQGEQQESLADTARRLKAQKAKAAAKVVTDDDVSKLSGRGVSVVGDGGAGSGEANANGYGNREESGDGQVANDNGEKYWRGRARDILSQIAGTDQAIAKLKDDIAKSGPTGVDPAKGLAQNVIYIHDRNAQMKQLEDRRTSLVKQLDDLADEGRKAGADSSWFR